MHPVRDNFPCTTPETAAAERITMFSREPLDQGHAAAEWSGRDNGRLFASWV